MNWKKYIIRIFSKLCWFSLFCATVSLAILVAFPDSVIFLRLLEASTVMLITVLLMEEIMGKRSKYLHQEIQEGSKMKNILKKLGIESLGDGIGFLIVFSLMGLLICFLIHMVIDGKMWRENYAGSLDNVYVRTETRKDVYEVAVKDMTKEKKKGSLYTLSFDRLDDGYTTTEFTRTFTEDEYKTFVGEGCNLLETDTHILSLIIPSRLNTAVYEVTVWRTAEFGEDQFSDDDVRKIAEAYLELLKEIDTFWNVFVLGTTDVLQEKQPAKELGLSRTKEWADYGDGKGILEKANDYWSSLEEEGYNKLSDE